MRNNFRKSMSGKRIVRNRLQSGRHIIIVLFFVYFIVLAGTSLSAQPFVYDQENTGANCQTPPLPSVSQLPSVSDLPDPFAWSDGNGRSTSFSDWACRRNEIKEEIEHYEIGNKPEVSSSQVSASFSGGTLSISVSANGQSMTMNFSVSLPSGTGPFPVVIGMNNPTGSLPSSIFTSRNVARITYDHDQVTTYGGPSNSDPFFRLYPSQNTTNTGQYAAWSWGISRIIDALEKTQGSLPIDLDHIAVTGCSYAGKMALFAGAFDERIALTIAQEPGGGGAAAWRVSKTLGEVETLCATDYRWFKDDMRDNFCNNEDKLPMDHHELMAMVAPRALLVLGNPNYEWLADESGYVSSRAAHEVWKTFGIGDRFGFSIVGGHSHCQLPSSQYPEVEAFVDKFLLGDMSANTNVTKHPFSGVNYESWYDSWLDLGGTTSANAGPDQTVIDADENGYESVTLNGSGSSAGSGSIVSFVWREGGSQIATGVSPSVTLSTGSHNITLTVTDSDGNTATDNVVITVSEGGDNMIVVSAQGVEGDEHINLRVNGTVIADWTLSTGYADYTAVTDLSGVVEVEFDNDGGDRDVQVDYIIANGEIREAEDQQSNTAVYQDGSCGGSYSEMMHCDGAINFGTLEGTTPTEQTPYGGSAAAIPGTIYTVEFDNGGSGIAYSDSDAGNNGDGLRGDTDVDTENRVSGGNVGWIEADEWLEYTVNVAAGTYTVTAEVASTGSNGAFHIEFGGSDVTGTISVPSTGDWGSFTDVTVSNVTIPGGEQVMRIYMDGSSFNIANVTFSGGSDTVPVSGVNVSPSELNLELGQTATLTASVTPANATNQSVTWSVSGSAVTVNSNGVVTGVSEGTATVTASTVDGGYTSSSSVAVTDGGSTVPVTGVLVSPTTSSVTVGSTISLAATVSPANATNQSVSWSTSDAAIATVSNGIVSGVSAGTAIITVATIDGGFTATSEITVTGGSEPACTNPVAVSIPFTQDGAGEYCFVTSQEIAYFNSWNMDLLEINGVDYTNTWSNSLPAAIDGNYYIHYVASVGWAHFEAPAAKNARGNFTQLDNSVKIYPNPLNNEKLFIDLGSAEGSSEIRILDLNGKVLYQEFYEESQHLEMDINLSTGIYMVQVIQNTITHVERLVVE